MFRKIKEDPKELPKEQLPQESKNAPILTRSRVREDNKNKKRNSWLNKAIIIVAILLAITIYAVFKL